jgi:isocitrate dehydrogenase
MGHLRGDDPIVFTRAVHHPTFADGPLSANIGENVCIFEAVHGTAPDIIGRDLANPAALVMSGCIMLRHLGLVPWGNRIEEALLAALQQWTRPRDLSGGRSFSTKGFTKTVVELLEAMPAITETPDYQPIQTQARTEQRMMVSPKEGEEVTVGVDLFIDSDRTPPEVATLVNSVCTDGLEVTMISNRGTQVWPTGSVFTDCVNHHRVRVECPNGVDADAIFQLAARVNRSLRVCSLEALLMIGDQRAYSLAQGQ